MIRSAFHGAAVLLLVAGLVASPAFAGGLALGHEKEPGLFDSLWEFLGSLLPPSGEVHARTDPDRQRHSLAAPSGSIMDPNGLTGSACPGESGSIMDPNGCPSARNQTAGSGSDSGSIMDPNG
jgi:hypothetical protein